jgi:hypothetical protein
MDKNMTERNGNGDIGRENDCTEEVLKILAWHNYICQLLNSYSIRSIPLDISRQPPFPIPLYPPVASTPRSVSTLALIANFGE